MSDDEEVHYVKRQKTIHYGSLEEQERKRIDAQDQDIADEQSQDSTSSGSSDGDKTSNDAPPGATQPQINISNEYMELEQPKVSMEKQVLLEEFERRKRARQINVPTSDLDVRSHLRELGEPICLFGEGPADRRERLRQILAKVGADIIKRHREEQREEKQEPDTTWYHEGPADIKEARIWIAKYSIPRAKERLLKSKAELLSVSESQRNATKQELIKALRSLNISCSQVGDSRPISDCKFSPDAQLIATASWSGLCKLWKSEDLSEIMSFHGHVCNVCSVNFHPFSTISQSPSSVNLVSTSTDGIVNYWNLESKDPITTIKDMCPSRVSHAVFHPSGKFIAFTVFDNTWRLWDVEKNMELLYQEGHSKSVYDVSFQCDGSLAVTGGMDSFGRVWDLRTGRCIMFLEGHLKSVLSTAFSPDGYHIATGSADHSVKVWDLRTRTCQYTIPAHKNLVSKVIFEPHHGRYLVTGSYDNTLRLWSAPDWTPLQALAGHDSKVMGADIAPRPISNGTGGKFSITLLTSSFDRTFKLWAPE